MRGRQRPAHGGRGRYPLVTQQPGRACLLADGDKTGGAFSPTTRYRDYAITPQFIHWESQSVVRQASDTGQRHQHHAEHGATIMLFARLRNDERAFWFLGPATYVSHRGEKPMAVTWKLDHALPGTCLRGLRRRWREAVPDLRLGSKPSGLGRWAPGSTRERKGGGLVVGSRAKPMGE